MIGCIDRVEVHDPEALQTHTYAGLRFESPDRLLLRSNFPGSVGFVVSGIDVTLRQT